MSDYPQVQFSLFEEEASLHVSPQVVAGCEYPEIDSGWAEDNIKGGNCPPKDTRELASWYRLAGGTWARKATNWQEAIDVVYVGGEWILMFPQDNQKKEQGH